jgi:hypothetical protein
MRSFLHGGPLWIANSNNIVLYKILKKSRNFHLLKIILNYLMQFAEQNTDLELCLYVNNLCADNFIIQL